MTFVIKMVAAFYDTKYRRVSTVNVSKKLNSLRFITLKNC